MPFKTWLLVLSVLYVGCDTPPKDVVPTDPPRMPAVRAAAAVPPEDVAPTDTLTKPAVPAAAAVPPKDAAPTDPPTEEAVFSSEGEMWMQLHHMALHSETVDYSVLKRGLSHRSSRVRDIAVSTFSFVLWDVEAKESAADQGLKLLLPDLMLCLDDSEVSVRKTALNVVNQRLCGHRPEWVADYFRSTGRQIISLESAISNNLVDLRIQGAGLNMVDLSLSTKASPWIIVRIPAGTVADSSGAEVQSMVITADRLAILDNGSLDLRCSAACLNMTKEIPEESDGFTLSSSLADPRIVALLRCDKFRAADWISKQYAIWTITDNPRRGSFRIIQQTNRMDGRELFTTPIRGLSDQFFEEIKAILISGGLNPSQFNAFSDGQQAIPAPAEEQKSRRQEKTQQRIAENARNAEIENAKWRTWGTADGLYRTEAKFVAFARGVVTLKKKDGQLIKLSIEKLADEDKEFIRQRKWLK